MGIKLDPYTSTHLTFGCLDGTPKRSKLITACIHGDEIAGMIAVNELIEEGFFDHGFDTENERVTIILGNPQAVIQKKRFIDINLNRIFTSQFINQNLQEDILPGDLYELSRLREIAKEIELCDDFLDLHSTSAPTLPFAIVAPTANSEAMAKQFPIRFVLHNVTKVIFGTSIDYAFSMNKDAVCVECGQHSQRSTIDVAKQTIRAFVSGYCDRSPKEVLFVDKSVILRNGFKFSKLTKAFDKVEYNQTIARDDVVGEIKCPYEQGAFLIMPIANPVLGEEAWLWGHPKTSENKSVV